MPPKSMLHPHVLQKEERTLGNRRGGEGEKRGEERGREGEGRAGKRGKGREDANTQKTQQRDDKIKIQACLFSKELRICKTS